MHEGGIAAPLIVMGPGISRASLSNQPVHIMDLMPTVLNFTQVNYPNIFQGEVIKPLSGIDISSVLTA
jgi:arylsulfatase A-like enzyme